MNLLHATPEEKADYHLFTRKFRKPEGERYRLPRRGAFELMAYAGERVVPYFNVSPELPASLLCVVYLDEAGHATEGKALMTVGEALERSYVGHLASQFLGGGSGGQSRHTRILVIGNHAFRLHFTSDDSWRGNAGEGRIETEVVALPDNAHRYGHQQALYAIDYVSAGGLDYAVDFNVAPGIPETEEVLSQLEGRSMLGALVAFYETHPEVSPRLEQG